MHRNRTWLLDPIELRTQRNRILPIEGGDGSTLTLDFTTGVLDPRLAFERLGGGTYTGNDGLVYGIDFATSSSLAIGTGSKSVTLTATAGVDRRYLVGQTVWISNGANNMRGPVTAYNASTQVLTINATGTTGSGSFTSWTVGNASARFDYDPTTLALKGLLIEGSANNTISNSNTIYTGAWGGSVGITATQDTTILDPSGGTTTCKIVKASPNQYVVRTQPIPTLTVPANSTVHLTISVWLRMDGANQVAASLGIFDGSSFGTRSGASVSNSAVTISSGSSADAEFTFGTVTGWVRCSISRSFTNATASPISFSTLQFYIYPNRLNTNTTTIYAWGAQAETGVGPTSLIPTGASTGSRVADYCTMPTSSFITGPLYPQTLFVDCIPANPSAASPDIVRLFDRTAGGTFNYGNEIYYFGSATMSVQRKINSSSGTDRALASGLTYNTRHKFATAINSASFLGSYDGVTGSGATTAAAALASQVTHLGIGCNGDASPFAVMFGTVRQIKFFPFAMAQAQLNALTTL